MVFLQIMDLSTMSSAVDEPASSTIRIGLSKVAAILAFNASLLPGLYTGPSAIGVSVACLAS